MGLNGEKGGFKFGFGPKRTPGASFVEIGVGPPTVLRPSLLQTLLSNTIPVLKSKESRKLAMEKRSARLQSACGGGRTNKHIKCLHFCCVIRRYFSAFSWDGVEGGIASGKNHFFPS